MWIDLTQLFSDEMPHGGTLPEPSFETVKDVAEDGINIQYYQVPTHVGTHVDAPRHLIKGGATIDELPLDRFAGEGVILDVSVDEPRAITVGDVKAASGEVQEDDVVLLYTGWEEKFGTPAYDPHPWFSVDLAEWFVDRGVKLVGADIITPDLPVPNRPAGWIEYPVHRTLLGEDVLIAEHLGNLASHTGKRAEIQGFPVKIDGGDGAPARFVARI